LANSSTTGYKTTEASFASMVTGTGSYATFTGAGVTSTPTQGITVQGTLVGSSNDTDLAIDGDGFFVVADSSTSDIFYYTRAGDFSTDDEGYLCNSSGYYLQGYATDEDGNVIGSTSAAGLEAINVDNIAGTAVATDEIDVTAVLPADAEVGDTFTVDVEIYDSLGVAHTVTFSYEKTATNEWGLSVSDPVSATDSTETTGTIDSSSFPISITFNEDGTLETPETIDLSISGWTSGAEDSSITYNVGTADETDGLSQYGTSDSDSDPDIVLDSVSQNGLRFGEYTSCSITDDGIVYANFDNGVKYAIYQIPLATFANADGLSAVSGTVYSSSVESGDPTLVDADSGSAGTIEAGQLEESTVDTADEFSKLIVAQQAYSAASEIISSVSDMYDDLMAAKR